MVGDSGPAGHGRLALRLAPFALATVVLRLVFLALFPAELDKDAAGYWRLATSLLAGEGLAEGGLPTASRLPGYPAFVAAVRVAAATDGPWAIGVAHALLDGLNALLIGLLAARLAAGGDRRPGVERVARLAAAAWALYPYAFVYASRVLTETLSVSLLLLAAVVAAGGSRVARGAALGALLAMLTYVKPSFLLFAPCWAAWTVIRAPGRRGAALRPGLAALVAFAVLMAPWPARNARVMGEPILGATNFGQSFFNGVWGLGTLGDPWDRRAAEHGPDGADPEEIARREALLAGVRALPEVERNRALGRIAARLVTEDPLHFARNAALTLPRLWLRFPWEVPPTARGLMLTLVQAVWLGAAIAGALALRRRGARDAGLVRFVEAVILYTVGIHLVTTPVVRYSFPAFALLCALIGQLGGGSALGAGSAPRAARPPPREGR